MKKKLTIASIKNSKHGVLIPTPVIRWVVANKDLISQEYKSGLYKKSKAVDFAIELRTKTGAKLGVTVRSAGVINTRLYTSPDQALSYEDLLEMGCPSIVQKYV